MQDLLSTPGLALASSPRRTEPAGLRSGAPLTRVDPPTRPFLLVAPELAAAEKELVALLASKVEEIPGSAGYLAAAGGKRLRPLLTALGARAVGVGGDISRLMCVGEMIHLGSLLHDDVVDDAEQRRGRPATQLVYGNATVILAGDFCLARAVLLAAEEGGHACVSGLARAVTAMAEGEVLQLKRAGKLDTTLEQYLEVVDRKSAALIAWCAGAGAHILDDAAVATDMEAFGRAVGVAFQVADDILDYGGEARVTGKAPGTDLKDRKLTLPLLLAMDRVPGLKERLEAGAPEGEELAEIMGLVVGCGALDDSRAFAKGKVQEGLGHLQGLPDTPYRAALVELAAYLADRAA